MINTSAKLFFVVFIINAFYFMLFKYCDNTGQGDTLFGQVIDKTDKTLITCLLIFLFSIGNFHFNDI
jgi:hypothetical protein